MDPKEHQLLCLTEECIEVATELMEVAKQTCKSLRFGLNDRNYLIPEGPTNVEHLIDELNDLLGVVNLLTNNGILPDDWVSEEKQLLKINKVLLNMDYARRQGTIQDGLI